MVPGRQRPSRPPGEPLLTILCWQARIAEALQCLYLSQQLLC